MCRKLSIVIPVFNEENTIQTILRRIHAVNLPLEKEIICIDDCSSDQTMNRLTQIQGELTGIQVYKNEKNRGKGFSVRQGIEKSTGEIIIIQDADLEYDPADYPKILQPILSGKADVVYGSRFLFTEPKPVFHFWHYVINRMLTLFFDIVSNLNLSDMATCYKAFRSEAVKKVKLTENRFGFDPEVTFKLAKIRGLRIFEVGVSYYGRTHKEGKKINWKDGVRAIYVIFKNGLHYLLRRGKAIYK